MQTPKEITNQDINEAMSSFCPFGYRDIETALQTIYQAEGLDYLPHEKLSEIIQDFQDSTGIQPLDEIDPVYCVYDYYQQMAHSDIEDATGKDISNDHPYCEVSLSGNYMCTSLDGSTEAVQATVDFIKTINVEDRTSPVVWYLSELEK